MLRPLLILSCSAAVLLAADEVGSGKKADGIPSPEASLKSLAVAPGLKAEVWASEPLLENPVAFAFDDSGRAYVVETNRRRTSTLDIRRNEPWVPAVLSHRTVADRVAFLEKELASAKKLKPSSTRPDVNKDGVFDIKDLAIESERVRVVEDSDGDGKADKSRVMGEGFNTVATGTAAGVLPLPRTIPGVADGDVLFACVPDLWLIKADGTKKSLSTGYGVHVAYSGHDMHGLRMGPDGRVYFSIADCGASVVGGDGKTIAAPDSGAVFRCWPDGSGLELFAKGLRNPQHLAFNELGDLFTADNNADGGDKARIIHVVEGADYGWRIGWQFLPKLGAWNSEGMWHLDAGERHVAILPPIAFVGHGPAGFSFYPGTGLPEKYRGHFFMADFPGGVRHFALKQKGASYEIADSAGDAPVLQNNQPNEMTGKLLWNLYPSDVQFPTGGGVMVLDWVQGWEKTGKGRIFRISAPELEKDALIAETKRLLGEGMAKRGAEELGKLLGHADQRVRMAAQFELVGRKDSATLLAAVQKGTSLIHRLHGIWGAARLKQGEELIRIFADSQREPEITAQILRSLADNNDPMARPFAANFLKERKHPRVHHAALITLQKVGDTHCLEFVSNALKLEGSIDPQMRHAYAQALSQCAARGKVDGSTGEFTRESKLPQDLLPDAGKLDQNLVWLEALRLSGDSRISQYLDDSQARLQLEAARAIHDEPIGDAMPALAAFASRTGFALPAKADARTSSEFEAFARRVVNANYRLGTTECADRLVALAAQSADGAEALASMLAADALTRWNEDTGIDAITGLYRGVAKDRPKQPFSEKGIARLDAGLSSASPKLQALLATAAGHCGVTTTAPTLLKLVTNDTAPSEVRVAALRALDKLATPQAAEGLTFATTARDKALVDAARRISVNRKPGDALGQIAKTLQSGSLAEQREAIETLGALDQPGADTELATLLTKMKSGKLPVALHLDVLEAAGKRSDAKVAGLLKDWEKTRKKDDALAAWRECLEGGDAKAGREIFAEKAEAACMRCHAVAKQGGDVGPDLAGIAAKRDRAYLLKAIIDPNSEIAQGYENVLVTLKDGNVLAGIAVSEDAQSVTLKNVGDGKTQVVKKDTIKEQQKLPSAMPPGLGEVLGKRALRDLVEYLATLK